MFLWYIFFTVIIVITDRMKIGAAIGLSIAAILLVAYQQHRAAEKYKAHREEYCSSLSIPAEQKKTCTEEGKSARDYLPWGYQLISWPEGITTWAIIITGFAIAWQSYETRRSALATQKSVALSRRQFQMVRDKERAKIEISSGSMELQTFNQSWYLEGSLKIRNLGTSKAYINRFQAEITWKDESAELAKPEFSDAGNIFVESFIDPTNTGEAPHDQKVFLVETEAINLDWFANGILDGRIKVFLRGVIEYATVGTVYERAFIFEWQPHADGFYLSVFYNNTPATTNNDKIGRGVWTAKGNREQEKNPNQRPKAN